MLPEADLAIIGGGYAAINALNAACQHLRRGARVVVVARERVWGGQWVGQYDYVRLHQSYREFTAGSRRWDLRKPWDHLASKPEVLRHFAGIAQACVDESGVDLIELWGYEAGPVSSAGNGDELRVAFRAAPVRRGGPPGAPPLPELTVRARRVINASGYQVPVKEPLPFSCSARGGGRPLVHSLAPADVLTAEWTNRMRFSADHDKPIWVLGSGKTAMDVMYQLARRVPGAAERLRCVSGRGSWFVCRDRIQPRGFVERNVYGSNLSPDWFFELINGYDGTNAAEHCRAMGRRGLLHSAVPDPGSFMLGICSEEEVAVVRSALTPVEERVVKAHVVDIVVSARGGPSMRLRALDGVTVSERDIPPGSFVINCTDHIHPVAHEPVVSHGGLVLSPQMLAGFSGPSANLCTHLWYLGRLEPLWRTLPRLDMDVRDKAGFGIHLLMCVMLSAGVLRAALPAPMRGEVPPNIPPHRLAVMALRLAVGPEAKRAMERLRLLTARYTDPPAMGKAAGPVPQVLGGNVRGTAAPRGRL